MLSSSFKNQAEYQAVQLGAAEMDRVFLEHPISDQTVAQLYAKSDGALDLVLAGLTSDTAITPVDCEMSPPAASAEGDECGS